MLERFYRLKGCITKAMIDLRTPVLSDNDFQVIKELVCLLEPIKVSVESLCRQDMNLYKADITLECMLKEIKKMSSSSPLGKDLENALTLRVQQRRTIASSLFRYLNDPNCIQDNNINNNPLFNTPKKDVLIKEFKNIMERLQKN